MHDVFDTPLSPGDTIAIARKGGIGRERVGMIRGTVTRPGAADRIHFTPDGETRETWTQPHLAVRIDAPEVAEERDQLREALADLLGDPDECRERYTVPALRRMAGLDPA